MNATTATPTPYTRDYFIDKFTALSDRDVGCGSLDRHCALWHVGSVLAQPGGYRLTTEGHAFLEILGMDVPDIVTLNDFGLDGYQQATPRARILAALRDLPADSH